MFTPGSHATEVKTAIKSWLESWFNGANHSIGSGDPVAFPSLTGIQFDQSAAIQPGDSETTIRQVRVIIAAQGPPRRCTPTQAAADAGALKTCYQSVILSHWITVHAPQREDSEYEVNRICDLLSAIYAAPAANVTLIEAGFTKLRPRPASPVPGDGKSMRLLVVNAEYQYPIQ